MKTDLNSLHFLQKEFYRRGNIQLNIYEDEFHRTDCWFEWKGQKYDVEVKKRRFDKEKYPTTIINVDKFVELCERNALLVVMFDDCGGICKNVYSAYIRTSIVYARSTTDFNGYGGYFSKVELDLNQFNGYSYETN